MESGARTSMDSREKRAPLPGHRRLVCGILLHKRNHDLSDVLGTNPFDRDAMGDYVFDLGCGEGRQNYGRAARGRDALRRLTTRAACVTRRG
ncbi:unnamed protein product [Urochloa humidicola]